MPDILIRDVPQPVRDEMKRRAEAAGMSLQSFVRTLFEDEVARPSLSDWLDDAGMHTDDQLAATGPA